MKQTIVLILGFLLVTATLGFLFLAWLLPTFDVVHRPSINLVKETTKADDGRSGESYFDTGEIHCEVTTAHRDARNWFDRGLAMCHGFNHEEAVHCFEKAIAADPHCAMAYWGLAYAWGPNINRMQVDEGQIGQAVLALRLAQLHSQHIQDWEREVIGATVPRYSTPAPLDRSPLNEAYASSMRQLHVRYSDRPLVVALFAESLMELYPWRLWTKSGEPAPCTLELVHVIEQGLKKWPADPMLCHLAIHALEASPDPLRALPAANRLRNATPGLGHLVHMPSHIDVRLGHYEDMIKANLAAIQSDKHFVEQRGRHNFYTIYRAHNYHFVVYGAMLSGKEQLALSHSREMVKEIPVEMIHQHRDLLDPFLATPYHAMIRFGKWDAILNEPKPELQFPFSTCIWHYARGIAYAATNRVAEARVEQAAFETTRQRVPDTSEFHNNSSRDVLLIPAAMLEGEIAYRDGALEHGFAELRKAVELEDNLHYDEPWGWMQPTRHALGALLAEQRQFDQAEQVYRDDLKRHPQNPWSLRGLHECLIERQSPEAEETLRQLQNATEHCDFTIDRACMCRQ
jgi:tetratricopeptide (TPR) repeat protein